MICNQCMHAAALRTSTRQIRTTTPSLRTQSRWVSSSSPRPATISSATQAAPRQGSPQSTHNPPAATSTGAAQPFSTPRSSSPKKQTPTGPVKSSPPPITVKSSVAAGTALKGLNFLKGKQDPIALEDHEYPPWLWTVLEQSAASKDSKAGADEGDLFSKSKKQRRAAAKALRKQQLLNPESLAPKIPLHEQTIDLPSGGKNSSFESNLDASSARSQLTKSMRTQRRAKIKEANFLTSVG